MVVWGMYSLDLWVLQVGCTVITSPEDPGGKVFRDEKLARQDNIMLHGCRESPPSTVKKGE